MSQCEDAPVGAGAGAVTVDIIGVEPESAAWRKPGGVTGI